MIKQTPMQVRVQARTEIEKKTAEFLARGGKIYKAKQGESGKNDVSRAFIISTEAERSARRGRERSKKVKEF